jgi:hypothetical protein
VFFQYGLGSISIMAAVGNVYINFALWAISLLPAWLVVREIGVTLGDAKIKREREQAQEESQERIRL